MSRKVTAKLWHFRLFMTRYDKFTVEEMLSRQVHQGIPRPSHTARSGGRNSYQLSPFRCQQCQHHQRPQGTRFLVFPPWKSAGNDRKDRSPRSPSPAQRVRSGSRSFNSIVLPALLGSIGWWPGPCRAWNEGSEDLSFLDMASDPQILANRWCSENDILVIMV